VTECYPEDRWEPIVTAEVVVGASGPESTLCDPPEDMPPARPLLGFRPIER
jgi:hypothetical protein